ncbi:MAG TPA: aminotransferase class I/II-fold pyridoxal phosphate-dependent enzyme [Flavitalea sp.]|nr:aminotransferase class I/II-fold pyridoxal phosphate-dependent enzyme [Flavitalea sp.]
MTQVKYPLAENALGMIPVASRLEGIGEYYFSRKLREIEDLNKVGKKVINLGIGSPDLPPHPEVIRVLHEESSRADTHAYQGYKGLAIFRQAIAIWYQQWYGVKVDPSTEVLPLIGSKEGIMHLCMTYLNAGDAALVPDPGYPTYQSAVRLAGGVPLTYSLTSETNWFPDFKTIENDLAQIKASGKKVKLMWVNYPHMPTGKLPTESLFKDLVAFGRKHNILICHDNPYSFILNEHPMSILGVPGAWDTAVELNSLSKAQNMAGWRVGMLLANAQRIEEVLRFKSNMDSGMFQPVQMAAVKALSLGKDWYVELNNVYAKRRQKAIEVLDAVHCKPLPDQAGLFVWARIPAHYNSGYELSDEILQAARVFITPGGIFGEQGNNYLRISLCSKIEQFDEAIERIRAVKST